MWGSKNVINVITLTSVLSNKCFLQLDVVWTKLHSRLFDLNSLRQMKIIAVENKSIPSPVKKLSYSRFFKLSLHLALFCWDCLLMRRKYNFSSARTLRYHAAVICQCLVPVSVPGRDDLPWLPSAPSWGFDSHASYSLYHCLHFQRNYTTWRTTSYKYLFSAHIEQMAFIRHILMDGIPVVGCGWLWSLRMDEWTVLPSSAPKWVPLISS